MRMKTSLPPLSFTILALISVFLVPPSCVVEAGDVGTGRRTGGIAEIDLVSAVHGSMVVRSLPTQEGAPQGLGALSDVIQIVNLANGALLGGGNTSADGQYNIVLPKPLTAGQRIQAVNVTRNFYSSGVVVRAAWAPVIDEPIAQGARVITGRGTPGSSIQIRHGVTGVLLGTGAVAPAPSNGQFTVKLNRSLPLFHSVRAIDVTKRLTGKIVPILNLLADHSSLLPACGASQTVSGGFVKKTFACGLPRPRGITLDPNGNPLIAVGTIPRDPGYAFLPAGIFRLSPANGALSLFAPVSGVALKTAPGGAFGTDLFVARPRLFNVRGRALVQPGDGEVFYVSAANSQIQVLTRLLGFAPTGMTFGTVGSPFPDELLVANFLGAGLRRIKPTGTASPFTTIRGLQGLEVSTGGAFGSHVFVTQPGGGRVARIAANGAATVFAAGMTSPMDVAFGIGGAFGTDLYVTDAGSGNILQINSAGKQRTFASGLKAPFGLVFRASPPALFVTDYLEGSVVQFIPS